MARTLKCQYTFDMPNFDKVSDNAKDFISSLLILSAEERFSAEQCLNHPWLTDNRVSQSNHINLSKYFQILMAS